ncbi:hypothetical protein [Bradyrhizobium pachyrhizi]|uniref:hypothetical protein n=1 Tax=Bradyrhizobium pachyrhizi TaxID=280333 RepID=UPI003D35E253
MLRPLILICIALFAVAMAGMRFLAHSIVDNFGTVGIFAALAALLGAAYLYDGRHRERP